MPSNTSSNKAVVPEAKKTELFGKVKSGQVRFLIGSTAKMGAGTNVQDRLYYHCTV